MLVPNADRKALTNLDGVREVGPESDSIVKEVHGMHEHQAGSLERVPGKLLMSTSVSTAPYWTICQLRFQGGSALIQKVGGIVESNPFTLPSVGLILNTSQGRLLDETHLEVDAGARLAFVPGSSLNVSVLYTGDQYYDQVIDFEEETEISGPYWTVGFTPTGWP